ncbi:hypothetical protein BV22DRAFT_1038882 [Leucogyrophana mollusca]|uniref:Uncharacterized protein n=1 Tax=Leucogyrophana mollusca TaxID=85980 RepID=A0ACB8B669_9AGAM|nr:hypothetical protein BV22DRAFT_1038882 [Leucogyrophana mollusca]
MPFAKWILKNSSSCAAPTTPVSCVNPGPKDGMDCPAHVDCITTSKDLSPPSPTLLTCEAIALRGLHARGTLSRFQRHQAECGRRELEAMKKKLLKHHGPPASNRPLEAPIVTDVVAPQGLPPALQSRADELQLLIRELGSLKEHIGGVRARQPIIDKIESLVDLFGIIEVLLDEEEEAIRKGIKQLATTIERRLGEAVDTDALEQGELLCRRSPGAKTTEAAPPYVAPTLVEDEGPIFLVGPQDGPADRKARRTGLHAFWPVRPLNRTGPVFDKAHLQKGPFRGWKKFTGLCKWITQKDSRLDRSVGPSLSSIPASDHSVPETITEIVTESENDSITDGPAV